MKKSGFTLLEILVVIVVVSILATLVTGAAGYALRVSREKRLAVSVKVLETAITRYRSEYNEWPGGYDGTDKSKKFEGAQNASVFGMLRVDSNDNPDRIRFLDETAFFAMDGGELVKLSETTGAKPLAFMTRSGKARYYTVTINYADETASVTAPGFEDEDDD